jgi:hypothetical protein
MGKPRKEGTITTPSYDDEKKIIKYFRCGHMDHHITNCKAKVVFSSEEAENKDIKEYSSVREEGKDGPSESRSVL